MLAENAADCGSNEFTRDSIRALEFAFIFQLQFAGHGGKRGVDVGDAGDDGFFSVAGGALFGAADEAFESCDGKTLADSGSAVDTLVFAGQKGDFFDDLTEIGRHVDLLAGIAPYPGFLGRDSHSFLDTRRIVRSNLRADAIFQRRDDLSARSVIFRIRGKNKKHVEREAQGIALNLDVAFLHDVEEADLNFSGQVGKFVDGENAAIGAREKPVVNREFVGEVASAAGRANRINISDDVGHGDIGRREFFDESIVSGHPGDGSIVAVGGDSFAAGAADRFQGIVVDFAARHDWHLRIEDVDEAAQNSALCLATKAKKNEIVARENGIDDLRDDGVFIAVHAREKRLALFDGAKQIATELILNGAGSAARIEIGDAL